MARESGGGGAIGWTLLGFLAGIAATLGVQTLMGGDEPTHHTTTAATSSGLHITASASSEPAAKPVKKPALAVASASPARSAPALQPSAEVADDAAAAGMTSRTSPATPVPADDVPPVNN
jgi:hypothetical protein